ncbi:MAG: alpha/beta fold hydrolase [Gemmatimonadaceae bacterium]|nr:alpha/beta fold hydrolase [Gemmatimonadaceae bacterium]
MPELLSSFCPAWWLPGAHLPTIWGKKGRRQAQIHERVERWTTPDGDHLSLARAGAVASGRPHLLVLHGLEGTTHSNYAQGLLAKARSLGWSADLILFRSCDGEANSARRLYHSGETTDLDFVVRTLVSRHPDVSLRVIGVSLGGNVLLKWLGEQGESLVSNVVRAAAVSAPFDLAAGSRYLECTLGQKYVDHFMVTLKAKTLAKRQMFPDLCDWTKLESARTFWEFDDFVTGPVHGFADALDYYTKSSSINLLTSIRRPTLLFNAEDDPFLPTQVLDRVRKLATDNDFLHFEFTKRGGHVGWVEGSPWAPRYYMEEKVISWLSSE